MRDSTLKYGVILLKTGTMAALNYKNTVAKILGYVNTQDTLDLEKIYDILNHDINCVHNAHFQVLTNFRFR